MRVTEEYSFHNYPTVILYSKDIKDIVTIFKNNTDGVHQIQVGRNILSDVEELSALQGEVFQTMEVKGRVYTDEGQRQWDHLSLGVNDKGTRIYISNNENARLLGLQKLLEQRLNENFRKFSRLSSLKALILLIIVTYASMFVILRYFNPYPGYASIIFPLSFVIPFTISFGTPYLTRSKITIAERSERPSFWERNRDALIINLLVGLLSAFFGVMLGYFFRVGG